MLLLRVALKKGCGIPALSAVVCWALVFSVAWKEYIFSKTTFLSSEPLGNRFRTFGGCETWGCDDPTICTGDAAEEKRFGIGKIFLMVGFN